MIQTETEYQKAVKQIEENEKYFEAERTKMAKEGMPADHIQRFLDPSISMIQDLKDDVEWYENAKKGRFLPITDTATLGRALIALRISRHMTQEELARKLDVAQSQVSRDESNEYHGISMDRVENILAVFGAKLKSELIISSDRGESPSRGRQAA
jgi:DNA-binding XRE family transcriptional regulator